MRRRDPVRAVIAMALAAMLAWTPVAVAQSPEDLLDRLEAGDRLRLTLRADRVPDGEAAALDAVFVSRDATSLRVRVDGLERDLPLADLTTVERRTSGAATTGALIGFALGGLAGWGLTEAADSGSQANERIDDAVVGDSDAGVAGFLIGGIAGAMAGALIGGANRERTEVVYSTVDFTAAPDGLRIDVTPISTGFGGLALVIEF